MPIKQVGAPSGVNSRKRFPLVASQNGRFLREQDGTPFLMIGDSPQSLFVNFNTTDAETYISTRASQGFNAFMVMLLCADYTFGQTNGATTDSIKPFSTGTTPATYDLSTPNATYWARIDAMLSLCNKYNICVLADPIETGGWLGCLQANGNTKAFNYGAFVGARYASFPNLIWLNGNDFQTWSSTPSDSTLVSNVMAGIASAAPHLQTIELDFQVSQSLQNTTTKPYTTMNAAYTYYPTYDCVLTAYGQSPTMPCFMVEANYEGENDTGNASDTPLRNRVQIWWTATSGASGQFSASYPAYWCGHGSTDWTDNMTSTWVTQFANYHRSFMAAIPWWNLAPDTGNAVLTSGFGTYDGSSSNTNIVTNNYATCAVDSTATGTASLAVVYTPVNHGLVVNMAKFRGSVTAQWYDPTNNTFASVSGSPFTASGSHTFTPSATNNAGDPDWVLLLQA